MGNKTVLPFVVSPGNRLEDSLDYNVLSVSKAALPIQALPRPGKVKPSESSTCLDFSFQW